MNTNNQKLSKKELLKANFFWLLSFITILSWWTYAAWDDIKSTWSTLTAAEWNNMVTRITAVPYYTKSCTAWNVFLSWWNITSTNWGKTWPWKIGDAWTYRNGYNYERRLNITECVNWYAKICGQQHGPCSNGGLSGVRCSCY